VWRLRLGKAFTNHYGNGPRVTPLIDGEIVYAVGTDGRLAAANKSSGEIVWQHDLVEEFATELPSYGFSSSPMIVGNKLLVEAGGKGATFMAFDKKTGEPAWSSQSDRPAYSSPIAVTIAGIEQVVFWSAHGLHSVSPDSGALLWKHSWETFCPVTGDPLNTGTPIFVPPDKIFLSSGSGAALLRVTRGTETFAVEPVWKSEQTRSDVNTAVRLGNYVYGFDRSILQCLDVRTGEVRWKARGFGRGSVVAADGKLFVLGEAEVLSGKSWTAPSIAGGKLYLRNHEELVCLDLEG
jgi:outer membrane protein assembly factor BamB